MKCIVFIALFYSLLVAENEYCSIVDITGNPSILSREFYNIGDTISEEDQTYPHEVCHTDGNYNIGSEFRFSDYSGDIILISMNATW